MHTPAAMVVRYLSKDASCTASYSENENKYENKRPNVYTRDIANNAVPQANEARSLRLLNRYVTSSIANGIVSIIIGVTAILRENTLELNRAPLKLLMVV